MPDGAEGPAALPPVVPIPPPLQHAFAALREVPVHFIDSCRKVEPGGRTRDRVVVITAERLFHCRPNGDITRCVPVAALAEVARRGSSVVITDGDAARREMLMESPDAAVRLSELLALLRRRILLLSSAPQQQQQQQQRRGPGPPTAQRQPSALSDSPPPPPPSEDSEDALAQISLSDAPPPPYEAGVRYFVPSERGGGSGAPSDRTPSEIPPPPSEPPDDDEGAVALGAGPPAAPRQGPLSITLHLAIEHRPRPGRAATASPSPLPRPEPAAVVVVPAVRPLQQIAADSSRQQLQLEAPPPRGDPLKCDAGVQAVPEPHSPSHRSTGPSTQSGCRRAEGSPEGSAPPRGASPAELLEAPPAPPPPDPSPVPPPPEARSCSRSSPPRAPAAEELPAPAPLWSPPPCGSATSTSPAGSPSPAPPPPAAEPRPAEAQPREEAAAGSPAPQSEQRLSAGGSSSRRLDASEPRAAAEAELAERARRAEEQLAATRAELVEARRRLVREKEAQLALLATRPQGGHRGAQDPRVAPRRSLLRRPPPVSPARGDWAAMRRICDSISDRLDDALSARGRSRSSLH